MKKEEILKILENYNLGKFKKIGKVLKNDSVSYIRIIETNKNKIVLKNFKIFGTHIKQGLKLMHLLKQKKYPVFKIYKTKNNNLFLKQNKICVGFPRYLENCLYFSKTFKNL